MINSGNHILLYQNKRNILVDKGFPHLARQKLIDMQLRDPAQPRNSLWNPWSRLTSAPATEVVAAHGQRHVRHHRRA